MEFLIEILSKIKSVIVRVGIEILTFTNKVFAISPDMLIDPGMIETAYGIPRPSPIRIAKTFVIPIAIIVGFIIYFKKSKNINLKKAIVTIITLIIVALIYFLLNNIF